MIDTRAISQAVSSAVSSEPHPQARVARRAVEQEGSHYVTFDEEGTSVAGKAQWGELLIAVQLDSDEGRDLLAQGWNATKKAFEKFEGFAWA